MVNKNNHKEIKEEMKNLKQKFLQKIATRWCRDGVFGTGTIVMLDLVFEELTEVFEEVEKHLNVVREAVKEGKFSEDEIYDLILEGGEDKKQEE